MKRSFWKALETLALSGAALHDWRFHLGSDFEACAPLLCPTGRTAFCVIDPRQPQRRLTVDPDGHGGFVGFDEDDTAVPPVPFPAADVAEFAPRWDAVAKALAAVVGFDHGVWERDGAVRRVGSIQDALGHVRPVLLFLPPGGFGDHAVLVRDLIGRTDSTVLLPSADWITPEIETLRDRNGLTFVDVAVRLAQAADDPAVRAPLPATGNHPRRPAGKKVRALIHGGNGLTWSQVRVTVGADRCIRLAAPGQTDNKYRFPSNARMTDEHALGILMLLVRDGEWRNPPLTSPTHERVSRAFRRLRALLKTLVPLPGDPFRKHRGAYVPVFQVGLHRGTMPDDEPEYDP